MVILTSPEQSINALELIVFIEFGKSMFVSVVMPLNAPSPIDVTLLSIIVFLQPLIRVFVRVSIIALQLFLES